MIARLPVTLTLTALALLVAAGCELPAEERRLTLVLVSPAELDLHPGQTFQLNALACYADGTLLDVTGEAGWSSSAPQVASIDGDGIVTARAPGAASVTATWEGTSSQPTRVVVSGPWLRELLALLSPPVAP